MPDSRFTPPKKPAPPAAPRAALEALLAGSAGGTLRRAQWLDTVNQLMRPHLPPGTAAHARLANIRGSRLVFVVEAPVWHAKLRLAAPALVDAARSIGLEVDAVTVKLATRSPPPHNAVAMPRIPVSAAAKKGLATALALLQPDPVDITEADRKAAPTGAPSPTR